MIKDGHGHFVVPEVLMPAETVHRNGSQLILHTYVCAMALDTIPAYVSIAQRKKEALALKNEIGPKVFTQKSSVLSKQLVARVNELSEGKAFDPIDFEKMAAGNGPQEAGNEAQGPEEQDNGGQNNGGENNGGENDVSSAAPLQSVGDDVGAVGGENDVSSAAIIALPFDG